MNVQIIDRIREKMSKECLPALKVSNETGIPAYRLYKWLAGKAKPKHEDVQILEKWLGGKMEEIPDKQTKEEFPDLLVQLMKQQNSLLSVQNKILEDQKESIAKTVLDTNLNVTRIQRGLQAMQMQLKSARLVVLESLERIEGKAAGSLIQEVNKKTAQTGHEKKKRGKHLIGGN